MNVAAAGKVVIGPAGKPGPVTMPIRIVVLRGKDVLFSRLYKQQVQAGQDATQWVFSDRSVVVPEPTAADIQVFAGFDEGPPPKRPVPAPKAERRSGVFRPGGERGERRDEFRPAADHGLGAGFGQRGRHGRDSCGPRR